MLQFVVRNDGPEAAGSVTCAKVPFLIGRDPTADFQLSAPGVWDFHAQLLLDADGRLVLQPLGGAIVLVNGVRTENARLRPGDEVQLGGAALAVGLSAVEQPLLVGHEAPAWLLIVLALVAQIALILWAR